MNARHTLRAAFSDLSHDFGRTLWTVLGLAVAILSFLILAALFEAYRTYGGRQASSHNLMILSAGILEPMESSLGADVLQAVEDLGPDVVARVSPSTFRHARIEDRLVQLRAVDPADLEPVYGLQLTQGTRPVADGEVLLSEGAARAGGWSVGSTIRMYGRDFRVVGLARTSGSQYASLWITETAGRSLFGPGRAVQLALVQLQPGVNPEAIRARLQADPRVAGEYAVYLERQVSDRYGEGVQDALVLTRVLLGLSLTAVAFGAYTSASLTLAERGWEVAVLRTLGFAPRSVRGFLSLRTLLQALAAYGLGWSAAVGFVAWHEARAPIVLHAAPLELGLKPPATALGLVLVLAFALLGVWASTARAFLRPAAEQLRR